MFIKTFWDVVLSEFPRSRYQIDVIILRRYLPAVLMSRVKLGHFGKRPVHGTAVQCDMCSAWLCVGVSAFLCGVLYYVRVREMITGTNDTCYRMDVHNKFCEFSHTTNCS